MLTRVSVTMKQSEPGTEMTNSDFQKQGDSQVRLENSVQIPLGSVLKDAKTGFDYIYIGRLKNTVGYNYHFKPEVTAYGLSGMIATFARLPAALAKFPGLKKYMREDLFQNLDKNTEEEMKSKIFEVVAAGFDGGSDETDDCVFWVSAPSEEVVKTAIEDTGAQLCGEMESTIPFSDVDYVLPRQAAQFSSVLLEKVSEHRNRNRPVAE